MSSGQRPITRIERLPGTGFSPHVEAGPRRPLLHKPQTSQPRRHQQPAPHRASPTSKQPQYPPSNQSTVRPDPRPLYPQIAKESDGALAITSEPHDCDSLLMLRRIAGRDTSLRRILAERLPSFGRGESFCSDDTWFAVEEYTDCSLAEIAASPVLQDKCRGSQWIAAIVWKVGTGSFAIGFLLITLHKLIQAVEVLEAEGIDHGNLRAGNIRFTRKGALKIGA